LPKKNVSTMDKKEEGKTKKQVIKKPDKSISNETPPIETKKEEKKVTKNKNSKKTVKKPVDKKEKNVKKKSTIKKTTKTKLRTIPPPIKKPEDPPEIKEIKKDIYKILKGRNLPLSIIEDIGSKVIEDKKLKTKLKDILSKTVEEYERNSIDPAEACGIIEELH